MHGFYAIMGGLAFEIPEDIPESRKFLPSHSKETWFITTEGVRLLSEQAEIRDILPNLSVEEINSRSKASGIAKTLVCFQALWFIAQCITRRTCQINDLIFSHVREPLADLYTSISCTKHSY